MRIRGSFGVLAALLLASGCDSGRPPTTESQATTPAAAALRSDHHEGADGQAGLDGPALAELRRVTAPFRDVENARRAGYALFGGCFSDPVLGGMGIHYANDALIGDSAVDARHPELMVYEQLPSGGLRLNAVEYIVFVDEWHAKGHDGPPRLFGQEFHINPTLLPKPFYLLHVWAWLDNPSGIFSDWNPRVQCR
ncbi:MAG TPA: hypothetical protein VNH46_04080 [Gemmatimonadales bacterium]|nr:hypothetical protein [Gemmatimonadales bacterium]